MTPTNMQPSMATRARRLRRPATAWNRLENAWPDRPAGAASDAMSLDMETSSLIRAAPLQPRVGVGARGALVLHVATPLVGLAQLATDLLVRVLGQAALARLADRLGNRAAAGADLAHAARLPDRRRAAGSASPRCSAAARCASSARRCAAASCSARCAAAAAAASARSRPWPWRRARPCRFAAFSRRFSAATRLASASALSTAGSPSCGSGAAAAGGGAERGGRGRRRRRRWRALRRAGALAVRASSMMIGGWRSARASVPPRPAASRSAAPARRPAVPGSSCP